MSSIRSAGTADRELGCDPDFRRKSATRESDGDDTPLRPGEPQTASWGATPTFGESRPPERATATTAVASTRTEYRELGCDPDFLGWVALSESDGY